MASTFGSVGPYWLFFILGVAVSLVSVLLHRKRDTDQLGEEELDAPPDDDG